MSYDLPRNNQNSVVVNRRVRLLSKDTNNCSIGNYNTVRSVPESEQWHGLLHSCGH